jgi:hypothetical protein
MNLPVLTYRRFCTKAYSRRQRSTGASHFDEVSITSSSWRVVLGVIRNAVGLEEK